MEIKIVKNMFAINANNNFTYVIEFKHNGNVIKKDIVEVPANEYGLPLEESCGGLTRSGLNANLEQLQYEYDFDMAQVPITSEVLSTPR
jgi:hypothetical protein